MMQSSSPGPQWAAHQMHDTDLSDGHLQHSFSIRLPAYSIFHAPPSISRELFSSLDILLRVAMKLINWGECCLTVNKPLDVCPFFSKFRHSFCKAFSVPYPRASLPSLFTAPWWHLFASSGPICLSFALLQSLLAACSPSQFVRRWCLVAAVPPPASHHQNPLWGFLPGWSLPLMHPQACS